MPFDFLDFTTITRPNRTAADAANINASGFASVQAALDSISGVANGANNSSGINTAAIAALTAADVGAIATTEKGAVNGVASLDAAGKLVASQLPAIDTAKTTVVADEAARLALASHANMQIAVETDDGEIHAINANLDPSVLGNWAKIGDVAVTGVTSAFGRTGAVVAVSGDYGSDEITNDSGVTGATVTAALDKNAADILLQIPLTQRAAANGVATLDAGTKIPIAQLPALGSDEINNDSGVAGALVTAALDQLNTDVGVNTAAIAALSSDDIGNDSGVVGATVTAALDTLDAAITGFESTANKGAPNGYCGLDAGGLVAISDLPPNSASSMVQKGDWNASTNSPALADGVGTKGDFYRVTVAGTTSLDGIASWAVDDLVYFDGTAWQKQAASAASDVASVFGRTGAVVAVSGDYGSSLITDQSDYATASVTAALNQAKSDTDTNTADIATNVAAIATKIANLVEDTTPQLGGNLDANGNDITMGGQSITGAVLVSPEIQSHTETYNDAGNVGAGGITFDPSVDNAQYHEVTMTAAGTITLKTPAFWAAGEVVHIVIRIDGGDTFAPTFAAKDKADSAGSVLWHGGAAPTPTADELYTFTCSADGVWVGRRVADSIA